MGLSYANLTVYLARRPALLTQLRRLRRVGFVSPTRSRYTVVFERSMDDQNTAYIESFGAALTSVLKCAAVAVTLHDDDVLRIWLFNKGRIRDRYNSLPSYFDTDAEPSPPSGGDAKLLCKTFERLYCEQRIQQLLRANLPNGDLPEVPGELERHAAITSELEMPREAVGLGYSAIREGRLTAFEEVEFEAI